MFSRFLKSLSLSFVVPCLALSSVLASEFSYPWRSANSSIVLDGYEYTPLDWTQMPKNKRLTAFISKASDGLAPKYRCGRDKICRLKWRRYAATQELYNTRKVLAKSQGLKWGAYHLARPGNPIKQAEHFLQFTKPEKDDLLALDIEHNDPSKWMSLADAEIFAKHVKMRIGRYPVLYTNHTTSKFIAKHRAKYPLLSRLNLWYARYKPTLGNVFPMGNWKSYTIWQFSSMVNCSDKSCLHRIKGADNWIDVNVVAMSPKELRKQWPFAELRAAPTLPVPQVMVRNFDTSKTDKTVVGAIAPVRTVKFTMPESVQAGVADVKIVMPSFRPGTRYQMAQLKSEPVQLASLQPAKPKTALVQPRIVRSSDAVQKNDSVLIGPDHIHAAMRRHRITAHHVFPADAVLTVGQREKPLFGHSRGGRGAM